jgi:hypothetical protein
LGQGGNGPTAPILDPLIKFPLGAFFPSRIPLGSLEEEECPRGEAVQHGGRPRCTLPALGE